MRVIKIGGRAQSDALVFEFTARAWRAAPGTILVVHGGGDEVSSLQRLMGIEPKFISGRRVTSEADIDILRMGLSGASNKRIVAALQSQGIRAIGVSGEDGLLIGAVQTPDTQLGQVGRPKEINTALLEVLLHAEYLPVISPIGRSLLDGAALNINGDDAAAAIGGAMRAEELLLVADVEGVLADGSVLSAMTSDQAERLIETGTATGGMIAKLDAALQALSLGVGRVRIGSPVMISDSNAGTTITPTPSLV